MSATYNQVPTLSTGPKMMGHHQHDQMHREGGTQPPFAADHPNAKQRKWRVLVSIGLLLPALAAIIGIVAWTISIEVANGNQQSPTSMAQRRSERAQMEQFRRDEALALAALVAARRSARQAHTLVATGSVAQPHQKKQQPGVERASVALAEAIVAQPNLPKAPRSMTPTTRPTRSNPQQQQQQSMSSNKQPLHQVSKNSDETNSIILKNREQADSLGNESSEDQEPSVLASSQAANLGEDEPEQGSRSQQTGSELGSDTSRDADDSASGSNLQSRSRASEPIEQRPVDTVSGTEDGRAIGAASESSADAEPEPAPVKTARQNNRASALKDSKSRWLSGKRPSASFSNSESSVTPVVTRKLASPKHNHSRAQLHKDKQQETAKSAKTKSKYTLLSTSEAVVGAEAGSDKNDYVERPSARSQPSAESATNESATNESATNESASDEQQEPRLEESTTTTTTTSTTTTQPSASDCHERVEQQTRANKPPPEAKDEDEDISFEAIASAISKTLSAGEQQTEGKQSDELAELPGDSAASGANADPSAAQEESASSSIEGSTSDSPGAELAPMKQKRRRTTGEHLAEVINHLVDRRKQQHQDGSRFGDRAAFPNDQERSQHGPQIVVVAPLGPSGALLKARSLTKAEEASNVTTASSAPIKSPSSTKVASTKSSGFKKPVEALKKQPAEVKWAKPIGGRLIGVGSAPDSPAKYSERVEVIEDEDSSSLLVPKSGAASDQLALEQEHVASIHVSSHSGEPRFRSPRHELSSSQMFERYAPIAQSFNERPASRQQERHANSGKSGEAKLYSAEQLIRNHILRSKANSNSNRPLPTTYQQQQQTGKEETRPKQEEASSTQVPPATSSSTQGSTSVSSPTSSKEPEMRANGLQQRQQEQEMMLPQQSQQQAQKQFSSSVQPVSVPAFYMQRSPIQLGQQEQQFNQPSEAFQVMESKHQQVRAEPSQGQRAEYLPEQQQHQSADSQQRQQQSAQIQPQMQHYLPTFADQEIQVPAHMAESVIRDLQQSASSVTGLMHGQQMVFQALPPGQQPRLPAHFFQNQAQQSLHHFNSMMPSQQHHYQSAESQQRPQFAQPNRVQSESPAPASSSSQSYSSAYSLNPFALVSRLVGGRRQQSDQKRKEAQDRQGLANRDSAPKDQQQQQPMEQDKESRSSRFIGTVKSFGPGSLVQPVAQLALKQVLSSIGQHAEALQQQAAAQQAEADAAEHSASQPQQRHSPTQQQRSSAPQMFQTPQHQHQQQQLVSVGEAMQTGGSSPIGVAALPPPLGQHDQLAAAASSRPMRSLPIGAQASASQQQVQIPIADQEVQESYGQMPAYHMPDHYNGAGRGYNHPAGYGGAHYESPDKKSKGITFHFGGGPVGGGTQLITSPMGIFKHLMIPLTRSQSSLNGKLVFGVVLEKTTHTNVLPKKKHKYWGR